MSTTQSRQKQTRILFPLSELAPGQIREVAVDGLRLAVFHTADGRVRAFRATCPHRGAALVDGRLQRMLDADERGRYCLSDTVVLRCPWHGYEFDVDTGISIAAPDQYRVRTFEVRVENNVVVFDR